MSEVVVVVSRPAGEGTRVFTLDPASVAGSPEIPPGLAHESELVAWMSGLGWRLTMVGGGSRGDEVRRFYFRRRPVGG